MLEDVEGEEQVVAARELIDGARVQPIDVREVEVFGHAVGLAEHGRRDVQAVDMLAALGERQRDAAHSATEVERAP